jgi:hypothetical protein
MKYTAALLPLLSLHLLHQLLHLLLSSPSTARGALFDSIIGMDLFAPVKDHDARAKKNIKLGSLTEWSYIPTGMSKAEYARIRKSGKDKKDKNYAANVGKAFKFIVYTEWSVHQAWN